MYQISATKFYEADLASFMKKGESAIVRVYQIVFSKSTGLFTVKSAVLEDL